MGRALLVALSFVLISAVASAIISDAATDDWRVAFAEVKAKVEELKAENNDLRRRVKELEALPTAATKLGRHACMHVGSKHRRRPGIAERMIALNLVFLVSQNGHFWRHGPSRRLSRRLHNDH